MIVYSRSGEDLFIGVFGRRTGIRDQAPASSPDQTCTGGRQERDVVRGTGNQAYQITKSNPYAFAQGVVWLAFEDLMPSQRRPTIAKRAVTWADSTVEIERLAK